MIWKPGPVALQEEKARRALRGSLDAFAREKGAGPDAPTRDELVERLLRDLSGLLRPPTCGQVVLLDRGEDGRYENPRLEDDAGRSAEEILFPEDEHGEVAERAVAHYVVWLPHPDAVPDL